MIVMVKVMAWCCQASHYLSQCWPRSMSPYGVTKPQWPYIIGTIGCNIIMFSLDIPHARTRPVLAQFRHIVTCLQDPSLKPRNAVSHLHFNFWSSRQCSSVCKMVGCLCVRHRGVIVCGVQGSKLMFQVTKTSYSKHTTSHKGGSRIWS